MGNCPNPNCNGTLIVSTGHDWEYIVSCDTCPFDSDDWPIQKATEEFNNQVESVLERALQELSKWVDEHGLPASVIDNWEKWEKYEVSVMTLHLKSGCMDNKEYWESRGVEFNG